MLKIEFNRLLMNLEKILIKFIQNSVKVEKES